VLVLTHAQAGADTESNVTAALELPRVGHGHGRITTGRSRLRTIA
jgi:hypothetical protein